MLLMVGMFCKSFIIRMVLNNLLSNEVLFNIPNNIILTNVGTSKLYPNLNFIPPGYPVCLQYFLFNNLELIFNEPTFVNISFDV